LHSASVLKFSVFLRKAKLPPYYYGSRSLPLRISDHELDKAGAPLIVEAKTFVVDFHSLKVCGRSLPAWQQLSRDAAIPAKILPLIIQFFPYLKNYLMKPTKMLVVVTF